jgi:hypothetical protein
VKRYVQEVGTAWVSRITEPVAGHDIYVVRITGPEMVAAFFRKVRTGEVILGDASRSVDNFKADFGSQYQVVEVTAGLADRAMDLAQRHSLRGYDAVQLAAAFELQMIRNQMRLQPLTFISADVALNNIAKSERLVADNPNAHP